MWTPRRIFLTLIGLLAFASIYLGYTRLMGSLDGLPPLPDDFKANAGPRPAAPSVKRTSTDPKFQLAFGADCIDLRFPVRREMKSRGVILSTYHFEIVTTGARSGWVKLAPVSVSAFVIFFNDTATTEIYTLYGDVAYVRFDRPVKALSDLDG